MQSKRLRAHYVYDPFLRVLHAWNGLMILLLLVTAQGADWLAWEWPGAALWVVHMWLGYGLVAGLLLRLVWGLAGPVHARWRAMWRPRAWLDGLRSRRLFQAPADFGHHPMASGAYLLVYLLLLVMAATGLALAAIDQGAGPLFDWLGYRVMWKPWFRLPHDWLQYVFMVFIVVHLAMLVLHERRHGVPVAQAMVSGYQYLKDEKRK